mmetsp:Transcript_64680/g.192761  ORF Transcript_64680/g.192761 Transcript_64680/m.192761 type:complete len:502 (-) Transcript_64680:25-1530(-)
MADDQDFKLGDRIVLVGIAGDPEINGSAGKLVKAIGKGRWAVMLDGKDKTTVVSTRNLERPAEGAAPPTPYTIVGTWDEWEPHEMQWNSGLRCFEFTATLGSDAMESFKLLLDGDWDLCVYPDRAGAHLHDGHTICGPDDGGMDQEWTIGLHQADCASPGVSYTVRVFMAGETVQSVKWASLQQERDQQAPIKQIVPKWQAQAVDDAPAPKGTRDSRRVSWQDQIQAPPAAKKPPPREESIDRVMEKVDKALEKADAYQQDYPPRESQRKAYDASQKQTAKDIESEEKEARERLARRLEMAAEAEVKMITDMEDEGMPGHLEQEKAKLLGKVEENRRRYNAQYGPREARAKANAAPARTDADKGAPVSKPVKEDVNVIKEKCMECNLLTDNVLDVGGFCCKTCWDGYQKAIKEGWDGCVLIEGKQAAQHAQRMVQLRGPAFTINMARLEVMAKYSSFFGKGAKKPAPYVATVRRCAECGRAATEGIRGQGDLWFCRACRPA